MKISAHLWRNQHGTWYFRAVIPKHLRHHFPQHRREIRRSLRTDSRTRAVRLARAVRVEFDDLLDRITMSKKDTVKTGLIEFAELSYGDVTIKGVKIDHGDDEKERESLKSIINTPPTATAPATPSEPDGSLLSKIIDKFCAERVRGGNWTAKTEEEYHGAYKLLLEIIGDQPITDISQETMLEYKEILSKLPSNMRKKPETRDKSIKEITVMPNVKPMSVSNVNKLITRTSSLLGWASRQGYINVNPAEGMTIKQRRRADSERDLLTVDELRTLFSGYIYQGKFPRASKPYNYQFWLPLLGLFTGARIEELCKLRLDDIRQINSVWCIDVKDAKTSAGTRLIPIHEQLISLGFIDYTSGMRKQETKHMFPELSEERDGFSQSASKWFARYRTRYGVGLKDGKKCFHSLRHTVIDCLKQQGDIPQEKIAAIVGHETGSITFGRYGKQYHPPALVDVVNAIEYPGLELSHIDFDAFKQRRKEQLPRF